MKKFTSAKNLILGFLMLFIYSASYSQTVYEWYQDGKVVFQIKTTAAYKLPQANQYKTIDIKAVEFINAIAEEYKIRRLVHLHPEVTDEKLVRTYQIEFDDYTKVEELIAEIKKYDFIEYAEKKEFHKLFYTPNDPQYTNQWHLTKIQAGLAWDISQGSSSIIVAVTDNAIRTTHPDLQNKLVGGRDVVDNDNDPNPCGSNDGLHGSHVSGIVGAQTNNATGIASIGFNVRIMPIKIGDCTGALTNAYDGIIWAYQNSAHVINCSWGGGGYSSYGQNVVNAAWNAGSIVVAAAGNDNVSTVFYPAGYNNVISVASTTTNDAKSGFSNYGTWIKISAPGSSILSCNATTGYTTLQGTSMASPLVSGLLGLMKSHGPSLTNTQLINCLYSSADNIDAVNSGYIGQLGAGRINAYQALLCINAATVARDAGISQVISPIGTTCNTTITPQVTLRNYGSNTLTSATINYRIDNNPIQTFAWTGSLTSGQTTNVTLPNMTTTSGQHTFIAYTTNPNNNTDQNTSNDTTTVSFGTFVTGLNLPFTETFESNSSTVSLWSVQNPDAATTWALYTIAGTTPGTRAAGIDFYNYATTGQRDGLISPPLNLSNMTTADLYFEHAYRRYNASSTDSLIIYVSTDCGQTYTRIWARGENGTGTLATQGTSTTAFYPSATNHWCMGPTGSSCFTISLNAYVGQPNLMIKFEGYNNYGNNLFVDNINISGTVAAVGPTASFTSNATSVCAGQSVQFTDQSSPNITTWSWSFPGGTPSSSTQQNPTVTYNTAGTYNVSLTVTNANGTNTITTNNYITVNALPTVTASASPTAICAGANATLTGGGANTYSWSNGLGTGATKTVSPTSTTTYTVTGTSTAGCTNTANITVTVNPLPTVNATASPTTVCAGSSATLTASGANSYSWSNGLGTGGTKTVSPTSTTTYTVTGTNTTTGCSNTANVTVNVNPLPSVTVTASNSSICVGSSVTLTAGGANSYSWSNGLGTGGTKTVSPTSTTTYTVTGTNTTTGCTNTATITITVNPLPTVNATASPTTICLGSTATLTATGANSYTWSNGLGNGGTKTVSPTATTTYTVTGTSTVTGCSNTANVTVTVNSLPTVTATGSPTAICAGASANLTAGGANSYSWNNGLGAGANKTVSPTSTTTYTVTGTNTTTGCSNTANVTITVNPLPTISTTATPSSICIGASTTIAASGASTYTWNNGLGAGASHTVSPTANTTYTVTGTSAAGCVNTANITVTVNPLPTVNASATSTTVCAGSATTLNAAGANTYTWNNGLGAGASHNVSPTTNTTYTVTGTSAAGCSNTASVSITVNALPTVTASASPATVCIGSSTTVSASGANTYTWDNGLGAGTSHLVSPTATTTYTVTGTNTATGCSNTSIVTVTVDNNAPVVVATVSSNTLCIGDTLIVDASNSPNIDTYNWNLSGGLPASSNNATEQVVYSTAGTYFVSLSASNSCGSNNSYSQQITVNPLPNVVAMPASDMICIGSSTTITASGANNYLWSPSTGLSSSSGAMVTASPSVSTTYVVTGYDANGCSASANVTITVDACAGINENAENSIFAYYNPQSQAVTIKVKATEAHRYTITVLNKLGQVIYSSNESLSFGEYMLNVPFVNYATGVYMINITNEKDRYTTKFIKP
jgi:PKD repeat protein